MTEPVAESYDKKNMVRLMRSLIECCLRVNGSKL